MKARTPSFMPRYRLLLAIAAGLLIVNAPVAAEDTASRGNDTPTSVPDATAANGEISSAGPRSSASTVPSRSTYQNPFAEDAKAPPIDGSLPSGTVNQWRRPTIPRWVAPPSEPVAEEMAPTAAAAQPANNAKPTTATKQAIRAQPGPPTAKPISPSAPVALIQPESVSSGPVFSASTPPNASSISASGAPKTNSSPTKTIADLPDTSEACLAQAQAAAPQAGSAEDLTRVIELCDRGIRGKPSVKLLPSLQRLAAWAHNRRGETRADAQQLDDALRDFQAAIELDPKCSLAIHNRGVTFAQQNRYAAALRDFNRVIELNPGLAIAYRNRAELLSVLDRTQDALADYDRAITSLPNDATLYLARAHARQRLGNFAGARFDIEQALKLNPEDAVALVQRGNLAADQGKFADAEKDFQHAIAVNPKLADAHRSLAWLQATCPDTNHRNAEQALASAKRATALLPNDYQVLDTLAAAEASTGNFRHAIELQQKAFSLAPRNFSNPIEERLALYQQHRAYLTPTAQREVRPASLEAPATPETKRTASPAQRVDIIR